MIAWYILSAIILLSALFVILNKNPMYSVLALVFTFFCISGHYLLLNAQFLFAVNIIVYAGAIMVLFLYVIMMLDLRRNLPESKSDMVKIGGVITGALLLTVLLWVLRNNNFTPVTEVTADTGLVENLGMTLYTKYLLPFELVSVLFFVALVGAVMLGKRETGERNF
jgi:NADH-quinone oxidoreductase subunit J